MEVDWTRHIVIGLIAALAVSAMLAWGGKAPPDRQGWRHVRPGGTYGFGIALGAAITLLMAWVWLFVGSDRPDGVQQMRILFWLILAFGGGTLVTMLQYRQSRRTALRWRGDTVCWHDKGGVEQARKLDEAIGLRKAFMGPVYIRFADGAEARVDPYARNAGALIEAVGKRL